MLRLESRNDPFLESPRSRNCLSGLPGQTLSLCNTAITWLHSRGMLVRWRGNCFRAVHLPVSKLFPCTWTAHVWSCDTVSEHVTLGGRSLEPLHSTLQYIAVSSSFDWSIQPGGSCKVGVLAAVLRLPYKYTHIPLYLIECKLLKYLTCLGGLPTLFKFNFCRTLSLFLYARPRRNFLPIYKTFNCFHMSISRILTDYYY